MKKQTIAIIVLAVLLVGVVGYIFSSQYVENKQEEQIGIYQQGAQYGYQQAVLQVMNAAADCDAVPLRGGNLTMNVGAVRSDASASAGADGFGLRQSATAINGVQIGASVGSLVTGSIHLYGLPR